MTATTIKPEAGKTFEQVIALGHFDARLQNLGVTNGEVRERIKNQRRKSHELAERIAESPIERISLNVLLDLPFNGFFTYPIPIHIAKGDEPFPSGDLVIIPQFVMARYRFDFALVAKRNDGAVKVVALECDGAAFHREKMAQIVRDEARDAYFANFGIQTFRVTGAALFCNARQALAPLADLLSEWKAGR